MEARLTRTALLAALLIVSMGARHQSANFIIETADSQLAVRFAQAAEQYRHDLAIEWVGQALPNWAQPCMMTVQVGPHLGAGGATTFVFDHGEVFGWRMTIQGSAERVLDSVLPHEITHMIYASYFRRPLPRWADEGGATSVEHMSEKQKHRSMLVQFLQTNRGIAFSQMFAMTEYPSDVMPLYAQGYSLAEFLIFQGGRRKYVDFLADGMRDGQWSAAIQRNYGITDLGVLQNTWVAWVAQGFPEPKREMLAVASRTPVAAIAVSATKESQPPRARPEPNLIHHIHDKEQAVPVSPSAGNSAAPATQTSARPDGTGVLPAGNAPGPATASTFAPQPVPSDGWRQAGPAEASSSANPAAAPPETTSTQTSRLPGMEPSRQLILEWNGPQQ